ncbi:hypothetical protein BOTBODRAFT_38276 [Botryobasidium botryosum FD-172 SS1]|uniref:SMP domain-containing protein n=1 Tax=Botryobasidium botryosum (strain FD-172 SS1) TaxID=930990 RepID=A0A067LXD8_BOTB1|nr:hypothetical protein BOTBODRAFT_38276 [Botryobasidium botryosum FD-172 SS1]
MAKKMTSSDASRIQSSQAKAGRDMSSNGFAARAQSSGAKNANNNGNKGGGKSSGGASTKGGTKSK